MPTGPKLRDQARGRGALSNASGRFEKQYAEPFDDGWEADEKPETLKTETIVEKPKTIITYNTSPDISFDRTINPYKGCEHGCIYCFARPNHAYRGLSPGLDFETKIFVKPSAPRPAGARAVEEELQARPHHAGGRHRHLPADREGAAHHARHPRSAGRATIIPSALITKSALILRDLDILAPMAAKGLVSVAISFTTLDRKLARTMEPRCAAPHRRLETMRELSAAGIPVTAMTAPMIPALNEPETRKPARSRSRRRRQARRLCAAAPAAGNRRACSPNGSRRTIPTAPRRVMSLLRSTHKGEDYRSEWKVRQRGDGPYAELIAARFKNATKRLGLNTVEFRACAPTCSALRRRKTQAAR